MSAAAAAVVSGERMFTAGFMAGIANVALPSRASLPWKWLKRSSPRPGSGPL